MLPLQFILTALLLFLPSSASPTPLEVNAKEIVKRTTCGTGISTTERDAVVSAFSSSGVVPTLIPSINPQVEVDVAYGSASVNLGNTITVLESTSAPSLSFTKQDCSDANTIKYSYFLVDPDIPNVGGTSSSHNFLHWFVAHAEPCGDMQSSQIIATYLSPTPASTSQHRYTFLVYKEPANYKPDVVTPQVRAGFNINAYVAAAGLELVGGNFFREGLTNI